MVTKLFPYFVMNGNGQEAVAFYKEALGATVVSLQTFGDLPEDQERPLPAEVKNRIMNAHLTIGEAEFMLSDTFPGQGHDVGSHVTAALTFSDQPTTEAVFSRLKEGGTVTMELQPTFWSPAYGQVTDRFGVMWQVSAEAVE
ncbi:glyoxalase/bleomycin resistance protein [Fictibacillus macauensis ZFHKF-1]|uniref:Glyoxalase/bleomycin resistance protein n=1 Tax=Fictibacillus macauensis ZFHKF-1 TaxID=1196324 RepID=I8J352_9BACL|nr:VOC family protein [Fictibacillus macauensis]EIT86186.1 glyoxalase/bleomycin resistance protein [Fictibacillus macauensis ZFHKF-1]